MKNLTIVSVILLLFLSSFIYAQKEIPITTSSAEAKELFLQGRDKTDELEFVRAAEFFNQAIAKDENFALAYCYLSMCGGGSKVIRANIEKAKSLAGKVTEGERIFIDAALASVDVNRPKQKKYLEQLIKMFPDDKRAMDGMGIYYFTVGDFKAAIKYLKKTTVIDKEFAPPYNMLGYAYMYTDNFKEAESTFKEYIRLSPQRANPYDSYAEFLLKQGRYDESIIQYQKAFDIDNLFLSGLSGIGDNYVFKGDYEKAREYYQKYLDKATRADERLGALFQKTISFLYENNLDEALKSFAEYRSLAEKENRSGTIIYSFAYEGYALVNMGKPADGLKKYQKAIKTIDKVELSDRSKENFHTYSNMWLAYAYAANDKLKEAKSSAAAYKKDVDRRNNPDEKELLEGALAFIDYKDGKYDTAIKGFSKLNPSPLWIFYQAEAQLKKGDKEAAKKLFEKIIGWNQNSIDLAVVWAQAKEALSK
jgi:tetratricopeptide (TPR) repeat protein